MAFAFFKKDFEKCCNHSSLIDETNAKTEWKKLVSPVCVLIPLKTSDYDLSWQGWPQDA